MRYESFKFEKNKTKQKQNCFALILSCRNCAERIANKCIHLFYNNNTSAHERIDICRLPTDRPLFGWCKWNSFLFSDEKIADHHKFIWIHFMQWWTKARNCPLKCTQKLQDRDEETHRQLQFYWMSAAAASNTTNRCFFFFTQIIKNDHRISVIKKFATVLRTYVVDWQTAYEQGS